MDGQQSIEQRKSKRYSVEKDIYVMLRQPQYTEMGKLIDISASGVAFLCANQGDWADLPFEIDILFTDEKNRQNHNLATLKGLPLKPIAYCRNDKKPNTKQEQGIYTRCGVEFADLSAEQQHRLDIFIHEHTHGSA